MSLLDTPEVKRNPWLKHYVAILETIVAELDPDKKHPLQPELEKVTQ
jgi:hypothetical protein